TGGASRKSTHAKAPGPRRRSGGGARRSGGEHLLAVARAERETDLVEPLTGRADDVARAVRALDLQHSRRLLLRAVGAVHAREGRVGVGAEVGGDLVEARLQRLARDGRGHLALQADALRDPREAALVPALVLVDDVDDL